MTHQEEVAQRIAQLRREKSFREERDVLQAEIAEAVGVSVVSYGRYENGQRRIPEEVIQTLAEFYGVTPQFIRYGIRDTVRVGSLEIPRASLHRFTEEELARAEALFARLEAETATPEPRPDAPARPPVRKANGGKRRG